MIDACKDIQTLTIDSYCMYIYQVRCTYAYVYVQCLIVHLLYAQLYTVTVHSMKCTIVTSVSLQTPHTHVRTYICTCLQYTILLSLQFYFCAYFHVANIIHGHQCTLTPAHQHHMHVVEQWQLCIEMCVQCVHT